MASQREAGLDGSLELLSDPRRRYALYHLRNETGAVEIGDLAAEIAAWERDDGDPAPEDLQTNVETSLWHVHLPKLARAGVVTVDDETDRVRLAGTDDVGRFLAQMARIDGCELAPAEDVPDAESPAPGIDD